MERMLSLSWVSLLMGLTLGASAPALAATCRLPALDVYRVGTKEHARLSLKTCDGEPNLDALVTLSVLARPKGVRRPTSGALKAWARAVQRGKANPNYVANGITRLHQGLLRRLNYIRRQFPGHALEIVSGHRPRARQTSRHHQGRALDLRLRGVANKRLVERLRAHPRCGVGYYPNSVFVHLDVRPRSGFWVDRSGPGEAADYGSWPPKRREQVVQREALLRKVSAELQALKGLDFTRL